MRRGMSMPGLALTLALAAAVALAGGCESNQKKSSRDTRPSGTYTKADDVSDRYPHRGAEERREQPPAQAERPAPAEQPARGGVYSPRVPAGYSASSLAFPTGELASSAILLHTVVPNEVRPGQAFEYEYHVTNLTGGTLQNVIVTAESATNMGIRASEPSFEQGPGGIFWNLGELGPRETRIIRVTGSAERVGVASNCIGVSYNNVLCAGIRVVEPQLEIVKSMPSEVLACDPITARFVVRNPGSGTATNVRIRDELPQGLRTANGQNVVEIPVGNLGPNESREFTVNLQATSTGSFNNTAMAMADGNLSVESTQVQTVVRKPVLRITANCPEQRILGRDAQFCFTVTNTGDGVAANTVVSAAVPANAEVINVSAGGTVSGGRVVWQVGSLAPEQARELCFTARSNTLGRISTSANANAACAEVVSAECSTNIIGVPAILLEVVDLDDPIEVGNTTTYVITVTNQGTATDSNIRIICELPAEQQFVAADGATSGTARGQIVEFAPLPSLAPKAQAQWRLTIRANGEGDVRLYTTLTSDQFTRKIEETESTNQYR